MVSLQHHYIRIIIVTSMILLLGACSSTGTVSPKTTDVSTDAEIGTLGTAPNAPNPRQEDEFKAGLDAFKSGNRKKAEDIFTAMTRAYPDFAAPYANLGMVLSQSRDYKKAEEAFKKSLLLNKNNPEVYNHLALVYRKMGRFDLALETYRAGLDISPDHPNLVLNIGVLYDLYLNEPEKALKYFYHYQKIVPHDKQVELWIEDISRRTIAKY